MGEIVCMGARQVKTGSSHGLTRRTAEHRCSKRSRANDRALLWLRHGLPQCAVAIPPMVLLSDLRSR